jgi:N12 class adenine-specific DNA methylase
LGCSLLSIIEIFFFAGLKVFSLMKRFKKRNEAVLEKKEDENFVTQKNFNEKIEKIFTKLENIEKKINLIDSSAFVGNKLKNSSEYHMSKNPHYQMIVEEIN